MPAKSSMWTRCEELDLIASFEAVTGAARSSDESVGVDDGEVDDPGGAVLHVGSREAC